MHILSRNANKKYRIIRPVDTQCYNWQHTPAYALRVLAPNVCYRSMSSLVAHSGYFSTDIFFIHSALLFFRTLSSIYSALTDFVSGKF